MHSKATTVEQYLAELPPDRRATIAAVRAVIRQNLDPLFQEVMACGMIGYVVPHSVYPPGYHCNPKLPLLFAGLASQKHHMSVYLTCVYGNRNHENWFRGAWAKTGKKLDMGKSCIRFKKLEDLALDVIGESIRRVPASAFVQHYESVLQGGRPRSAARKPKPPTKRRSASPRRKP